MKAIDGVVIESRRLDPAKDAGFDGFADTPAGQALAARIVETETGQRPTITNANTGNGRIRFTALTASLLVVGLASAAGAAYWLTARTGKTVQGPMPNEQVIGAEIIRLDAPDLSEVVDELAESYPLAPGMTTERITERISTDEPTEMDEVGVESMVAYLSYCGWAKEWLTATTTGDHTSARKAVAVLQEVPEWKVFAATDGGGVVENFRRLAAAAAAGDTEPVRRDLAINC